MNPGSTKTDEDWVFHPTRIDGPHDGGPKAKGVLASRDSEELLLQPLPERLGRFQIVGRLGQGAMGTVLEGYDETLDRKVAVKQLYEGSGHHRQRLIREAQALARLSHPNVVGVYDAGEHEGRFYIAMELVDGQTLADWQKTPRPWTDCLRVYLGAGRGLAAVHAEGIIHRDFKPTNCIIDAQGNAKVLDFGLARGVDDHEDYDFERAPSVPARALESEPDLMEAGRGGDETDDGDDAEDRLGPASEAGDEADRGLSTAAREVETVSVPPGSVSAAGVGESGLRRTASTSGAALSALSLHLTRTGMMLGTPAYMAPEQAAGEPTDARCDQFSFCVALYEAIYGERPFPGNPGLAIAAGHAPSFTGKTPAGLPTVPHWLQSVLRRGLAPARDDRFPAMNDLLAALERGHRRRRTVGLAAAGLITVVAGAGLALAKGNNPCEGLSKAPMTAWSGTQRAVVEQALLGTRSEHAVGAWEATAAGLDAYAREWTEVRTQACEATRVERVAGEDLLELRMACLDRRAMRVAATVGLLSDADEHRVAHAAQLVRSLPPVAPCLDATRLREIPVLPDDLVDHGERIRAKIAHSWALDAVGQAQRGLPAAEEAVRDADALGPEAALLLAEARYSRGRLYRAARRLSEARDDLQSVLLYAETHGVETLALDTLRELLAVAQDGGDRSAFAAWMTVARGRLRRMPDEPLRQAQLSYLEGLRALSDDDDVDGQGPEAAAEQLRAAVEQFRLVGDEAVLDTGRALLQLAVAQIDVRRDEEAEQTLAEAETLAQREGLLPLQSEIALERGRLHFDRGRFEPAERWLRHSLSLRVTFDGPAAPSTIPPRVMLAMLLRQQGHLTAAQAMVEEARSSLTPEVPPHSRAQVMSLLARVHRQQGDWDAALADYQQVDDALAAVPTPDPVEQAMLQSNMADCLRMMSRYEAARIHYGRALDGLQIHVSADDFRWVYPLYGLGSLLEETGDRAGARAAYRRALAVQTASPRDRDMGTTLRWKLARTVLDDPQSPAPEQQQARDHLDEALQRARTSGDALRVAQITSFIDECGPRCRAEPSPQ